jgi:hypothetical protein
VTGNEASAPQVAITTSSATVTNVNVGNKVLLAGNVQSDVACSATWSNLENSVSLDSAIVSGTSYSATVPGGSSATSLYLYLQANVLAVRSSYSFALSCGASTAKIVVSTNGPPLVSKHIHK